MPAAAPAARTIALLHAEIPRWFAAHARDLPWRHADRTPWGVMVSEFMLQQTPVNRVLPVWQEWLETWPTPSSLANASPAQVLRAWGRLGYPRRALRLKAAAAAIVDQHDGEVPASYTALLALPGVGTYTAAAIAAFAFGRRETVVDTNIRRVHARLFSAQALPAPSLTAAETRLAKALLPMDEADSAAWNAAVMELGAVICTARSPKCGDCPVRELCAWQAAGRPDAERVPTGQAWAGTDRQVRGAMMAVLRNAETGVPRELLLGLQPVAMPNADPVGADPVGALPVGAAPAGAADLTLARLHALDAPLEQLERALSGLVADGLAHGADGLVSLPN